jgi:hypothetical protein
VPVAVIEAIVIVIVIVVVVVVMAPRGASVSSVALVPVPAESFEKVLENAHGVLAIRAPNVPISGDDVP